MAATLKAIALAAGVTPATVSMALNGKPGVGAARREAIERIAREMGYAPNPAARALARRRTQAVGVFLSQFGLAGGDFLQGVLGQLSPTGDAQSAYIVAARELPARRPADFFARVARERRFDGVIVLDPLANDLELAAFRDERAAVVLAGRRSRTLDCIEAGIAPAALELLAALRGVTRGPVALVATLRQIQRHEEPIGSWERFLHGAGLDPRRASQFAVSGNTVEEGLRLAAALPQTTGWSGIFCAAGDEAAAGLQRGLRARGEAEIRIAGFGDTPASLAADPPLPTVRLPWREMGERAAATLLRRIERPDAPRQHHALDCAALLRG